jgi:putative hemolysin
MPAAGDTNEPPAVRREDGSWLVDGTIPIADLKDILKVPKLPAEERGAYRTLGGFVMNQLGRVPATGDHFEWNALRFEVVDMDGHLVDKVLVSREGDRLEAEEE